MYQGRRQGYENSPNRYSFKFKIKLRSMSDIESFASSLFWKMANYCCLFLLVSGCASYGIVENSVMTDQASTEQYSIKSYAETRKDEDIFLLLSFSGGGTRAAAMAYGVMLELRDTNVTLRKGSVRLLDTVDTITSVSGGSFTAA